MQTTSEIVDLTVKGGNMCNNWPDFPIDIMGATGGLIGNTIIICGGYSDGYERGCFSLTSEKATYVTSMSIGRMFASSIVLNDNKLWVTGGYGSNGYNQDSTTIGSIATCYPQNFVIENNARCKPSLNNH